MSLQQQRSGRSSSSRRIRASSIPAHPRLTRTLSPKIFHGRSRGHTRRTPSVSCHPFGCCGLLRAISALRWLSTLRGRREAGKIGRGLLWCARAAAFRPLFPKSGATGDHGGSGAPTIRLSWVFTGPSDGVTDGRPSGGRRRTAHAKSLNPGPDGQDQDGKGVNSYLGLNWDTGDVLA